MLKFHLSLLLIALLFGSFAQAQTTYRWVDKATGQTIFSDQPPPPGTKAVSTRISDDKGDEQPLPYATRQAADKFPVALFTTSNCLEACKQGRDLLNSRGIPFSEKLLQSQEEYAELSKKLGSEAVFPSIFVGQQNFKGFENGAWNNLLDLAGYPASAPYGAKPSGVFAK
ncbi:MAG: glutaredoxin family protein [Betaproteobacteria bacterium]